MGMSYASLKHDGKKHLAFTGLTTKEFACLLGAFDKICETTRAKQTTTGEPRKRKPGAGRKPQLALAEDQLLFILFYLKTYPLQEVMGELFDLPTSTVNEWIHRLLPVLQQALNDLEVLPERDAKRFAEAQKASKTSKDVIIDGTERRRQRPKDKVKQSLHYSGKKKTHTDKNVLITERRTGRVSYLSKTYPGTAHDKKIADYEAIAYAPDTVLHKDTGFQGYEPAVKRTHQPKKATQSRTYRG
jgi:Helix-turn-helix of DDE superfamily endonuclease/DDE superfamily endonuclease